MHMHRTGQAVVRDGTVSITDLPLPDGQRVQFVLTDVPSDEKRTIAEVQAILKGGVEKCDMPFEPSIPEDSWEMLK